MGPGISVQGACPLSSVCNRSAAVFNCKRAESTSLVLKISWYRSAQSTDLPKIAMSAQCFSCCGFWDQRNRASARLVSRAFASALSSCRTDSEIAIPTGGTLRTVSDELSAGPSAKRLIVITWTDAKIRTRDRLGSSCQGRFAVHIEKFMGLL